MTLKYIHRNRWTKKPSEKSRINMYSRNRHIKNIVKAAVKK